MCVSSADAERVCLKSSNPLPGRHEYRRKRHQLRHRRRRRDRCEGAVVRLCRVARVVPGQMREERARKTYMADL